LELLGEENEKNDPTIDRIREVRHEISAEFGHDPKRLVAFYADLEKEFSDRFVAERPVRKKVSMG
jgi:hypothetical protein